MLKSELRKIYLERRHSLEPNHVAEMSGRIRDRFFASTDLDTVRVLHSFIPIPRFHEVDVWAIIHATWRDHPRITTVTSVSGREPAVLEHAEFSLETEFAVSSFGIKEPVGERSVEPSAIDLVLVPLLCFDGQGYRVGYGKGLYDRFLVQCRSDCLKIGLSFFGPVESIDDVAVHDIPLDRCIMPGELIVFDR